MPGDRPSARELIETVAEYLVADIRPRLSGHAAFEVLISANLLAIAIRELETGYDLTELDRQELGSLLIQDGPLDELEQELAERIRDGSLDDRADATRACLRASARRHLAVANPGYAHEDR